MTGTEAYNRGISQIETFKVVLDDDFEAWKGFHEAYLKGYVAALRFNMSSGEHSRLLNELESTGKEIYRKYQERKERDHEQGNV